MAPKPPTHIFKRFTSTATTPLTITTKPTPSKSHLHLPIPRSSFPRGYVLSGIHAGIKKNPDIPDLAVILSESPPLRTSAAACFTRNAFKAAPVLVSQEVLEKGGGRARAIVVNSGCANAVTGKKGMEDAWAMVRETDGLLKSLEKGAGETLVMSTGVIGQNLPIKKIVEGIRSHSNRPNQFPKPLSGDFGAWEDAARAFMTTDTFPKLRARTFVIAGREYRMAGMDKGAGMIHPDMGPPSSFSSSTSGGLHATLLGCILTDVAISPRSLQSALTYAVERSFNSISVDGDMSTNDTIVVLANGAAAASAGRVGMGRDEHVEWTGWENLEEIDEERDRASYEIFKEELTAFAIDLAKLVVRDGEGATKFVTVTVDVSPLPPTHPFFPDVFSRLSKLTDSL